MRKLRFAVVAAAGVAFGVVAGWRSGLLGSALKGGDGIGAIPAFPREVAAQGNGHDAKTFATPAPVQFPDRELLRQCVHCGLCLPYCPTYRALSLEADSPRGRIFQMRLVADGEVSPDDPHFRKHMFQCLDCRACETACPSGVQYGRLIEAARSIIPPENRTEKIARRVLLGELLNSRRMLTAVGVGSRLYQRSGLQSLVRGTGLLTPLRALKRMESMLPSLQGALVSRPLPAYAPAQGERRHRVALLSGCVAAQFFPETNNSTIAVLAANGCDVFTPPDQGCCGALQNHSGDRETALRLARHNIDVFERVEPNYIVVNSAGCGSMMKEYGDLLRDDPDYAERARAFSAKVRDISELLVELPFKPPVRELRLRVTYQDACHLAHGQKVRSAPREILWSIPGLQLVEMRDSDQCCGSAGTYNVTQPELSEMILAPKVKNVVATAADVVVVGNPGCLIQLEHGLRERGIKIRTAHPVDLLAEAYGLGVKGVTAQR